MCVCPVYLKRFRARSLLHLFLQPSTIVRSMCEVGTLQLPNEKYIGYRKRHGQSSKPGILFCAGFLSNLNGTKKVDLDEYRERNDISYAATSFPATPWMILVLPNGNRTDIGCV